MGTVEVGAMPTSDGMMGWSTESNVVEGAQWKNLSDGEGGKVGLVDGLRDG